MDLGLSVCETFQDVFHVFITWHQLVITRM